MAKKEENRPNLGQVVLFGNYNYSYDHDKEEWNKHDDPNPYNRICEVLDVQDVFKDRVVTEKYVLPIADAEIHNGPTGAVYCYNASLPYLAETSHLAEVEKNIVIGQAYLYQGKNIRNGAPSPMQWVMLLAIIIFALVGILT
jgi:hypothetical protein